MNTAPPETKVVAAGAYGVLTLIVTWILTNYVFHGAMPADLANLLPGFVAVVAGSAAGWASKHTPRPTEVAAAVQELLTQPQAVTATPPAPVVSPVVAVPPWEPAGVPVVSPDPAPGAGG